MDRQSISNGSAIIYNFVLKRQLLLCYCVIHYLFDNNSTIFISLKNLYICDITKDAQYTWIKVLRFRFLIYEFYCLVDKTQNIIFCNAKLEASCSMIHYLEHNVSVLSPETCNAPTSLSSTNQSLYRAKKLNSISISITKQVTGYSDVFCLE